MSIKEKSYVAGFLDGDGCIMAQLVRRKDYALGYQIRTSIVFYQKNIHKEILYWLMKKIKYGYIRDRKDGMFEYTIVGLKETLKILNLLLPYLRLKKKVAKTVIKIIENHPKKLNKTALIRLSYLVDETANYNYSKRRTINSQIIIDFFEQKSKT